MSQQGGPNPTPTETPSFNGEFLAYLVVCGALAVFFLLYFNRAFGSLLSWGIRTYTWHRYRIYLDIQALQVSLLGGRIFFTGLRYHGNNETFLVQHGYVTWRYWLRRVREVDIKASAQQQAEQASAATNGRHSNLPCRVTMSLVGLEWFIYNRSPAYDSVLAGLKEPATTENVSTAYEPKDDSGSLRNRGQRNSEKSDNSQEAPEKETPGAALLSRIGNTLGRRSSDSQISTTSHAPEGTADVAPLDSDLPFLLQLFPIFVTCQKAAVVMGNDNTKAILIVKADGLSGEIDASKTSTPDPYKQIFKIKFQHPIVEMRENDDFKEDQATRASREKVAAQEPSPTFKTSFFKRHRRRALGQLRNLVPYWRKSVESFSLGSRSPLTTAVSQIPGSNHWQGLARYLDEDEQDSRLRWAGVEYAAETTIVDSPEATLTIYWDVVGKVHAEAASRRQFKETTAATYINGDEAPAWGMILAINGGIVNYGPWADRQRADLQRVFVPSLSKDAVPATPLAEGEYRVPTQFKLYVELDDEVTLRIPIREDSKNWRWKGKEPPIKTTPPQQQKRKQRNRAKKGNSNSSSNSNNNNNNKTDAAPVRPGGWLDFIVPGNATISFTMDMLASATGYHMKLDVDLPSTELASSVNHELLWRSGPQRISCDLSTPLKWNSLRSWYFNVVADDLELFMLRDHVFLLIDLVDDWATGPPAEYLVFTPFRYYLNLDLRNVKLYLNANDGNIINNPTDLEDNAYVVARSPSLVANVCIPIDKYRPSMNAVSFSFGAETFSLSLHVPPWNTQAAFIASKEIGQGENFELDGAYTYNATTSPANIDTLTLNLGLQSPTITLYGFLIRYFLVLKDNYLGDYIHFKTLEEYQELLRAKERNPDAELDTRPPPKKSNDLDVILCVKVDDPRIILPANLYSSERHIQIETAGLSLDLRFTNYYMDLQVNLNPLNLSLGNTESGMETPVSAVSSTQLFIDGVTIYGHRLFGLPPTEPTYLCNWDISVGMVSGECSTDFLTALVSGGKAFAFEFDDDENALIPLSSIVVYDVTFLRVAVQAVRVWCHVDEAAFLFSTGTLDVKFNDWARTHYSRRADIKIPDFQISCVNSESAMRHKWKSQHSVETDAFFQASLRVAIIGRKYHFSEERRLQQELIRREDQRTGRTEFLLLPGILEDMPPDQLDPPAQDAPPVPHPTAVDGVDDDRRSFDNQSNYSRTRRLRHKSSFLSTTTTSSTSSVVRPMSSVRSRAKSRQSDFWHPDSPEALGKRQTHQRDISTSTGRHSAFYSAVGDFQRDVNQHSSVAFASQFFTPPFPLESIRPDTSKAVMQSIETDEESSSFDFSDLNLDDIDLDTLAEDRAHNSIILEIPSGLTAFLNPSAVRHVSLLVAALQPSEPENILDSLQIAAMTDIFDHQKKKKIAGEITDVMVRVPKASLRFLNSSSVDRLNPGGEEQDQYDVALSKLSMCLRSTDAWENPTEPVKSNKRTSVLLKLGSAEASASERLSGAEENQAAFMAQIEHVVVSLGSSDVTYIDADVGTIKSSTASEKIEYLASLIHRTGVVAADLGEMLEQTMSRHDARIRYFVYKLMTDGHPVGDPSFLTRPSAVLRSAPEHLRTFDSWKMAARLRQMWTRMPASFRDDLQISCLSGSVSPPPDASQRVIDGFQRWRSWDLYNVSGSELIKNVFGVIEGNDNIEAPELPILAALRLRDVRLLLDPGPKENRIVFSDLTTRLEKKVVTPPEPSHDLQSKPSSMTVLNVYCGEAAVMLNWELCELAEDILRLYNKSSRASKSEQENKKAAVSTKKSKSQEAFHVVLAIGRGSVEVDTINLSATSLGHNLKVSCLIDGYEKTSSSINFILSCDAVTSRLHHRAELLGMFQLRDPSVFVSHELLETDTKSCHTIKSTASSRALTLAVKQDPLFLVEVAEYLVKDELTQIHKLQKQLPDSPTPRPRRDSIKIAERLSSFRVNVAMFLDEYLISVPLLQSMTYNIAGVVARAAVAANFGKELIFDFDVKENSHEVRMDIRNQPRSISLLRIPPTNGRIVSHMGHGEHSVSVFGSVELMQLDASAVYSLLRALNRPQISSAIAELQEGTKAIQGHISEIFGESPAPRETASPPQASQSTLVYTVHLTLAGIEVFGNTPVVSEKDPVACLSFALDRVHLEVSNRHDSHGPILAQPELNVNLRQILIDVQKGRENAMRSCGSLALGALISANTKCKEGGKEERSFNFRSDGLEINLSPETVSTVVAALGYMGDKIKDLDTSRELEYLRRIRQSRPRIAINGQEEAEEPDIIDSFLSSIVYRFEVRDTRICWLVGDPSNDLLPLAGSKEDLILSVQLISFGTRQTKSARLTIENFQLQMVPPGQDKTLRSLHSALLPEVVFNIAYVSNPNTRRLAFQAVGKSLDLRLTSGFIIPAAILNDSIGLSIKNVQRASQNWTAGTAPAKIDKVERVEEPASPGRSILGTKRLESLLVDADFSGAVVYVSGKKPTDGLRGSSRAGRPSLAGKYGQFSTDDSGSSTVLRTPGLAWKFEYRDNGREDPSLYGEIKIDASSNILYPSVVPLIMDMTASVKEVVSKDTDGAMVQTTAAAKPKPGNEDNILTADPNAVIGRLKLNLGLRICRQEFSLSCQPIARVAATTCFDDIYFTVNTVRSVEQGNFFSISGAFSKLQASVQHVYSRESTGSFDVDSIVLSLMNSKHVSGTSGVSAILKVSPMNVSINAKQLQDFLLFREIWYPNELRNTSTAPVAKLPTETSQGHLVQRYQQVAATAAFPWTATISIASLDVSVDMGQAIGKSVFAIKEFWVSSKKTSDWEQNLCLGFERIGIDCSGRLSGFIALQKFQLRTSIQWPEREQALNETPLIQASVGFSQFRVKAAFDYQAFLVADITSLALLMYNVRRSLEGSGDRLVAIFDGDAVQVFGTTTSAAQGVALYQAVQKLIQERRANFEMSLQEIEKFMRRRSYGNSAVSPQLTSLPKFREEDTLSKSPISLDTDVVVTLKALNLGVFPSTFSDHQVFKMEALDAEARFAASIEQRRIHSILGLTLGQLRIGLAGVRNIEAPKTLSEISVEDVVERATGSRGGTILKVPKVGAVMQTWQTPNRNQIEYIFKSAFEGKVEVGWNYSRISYIRGMWANHSKSLEQTWGKELPLTAIKVTGVPDTEEQQAGGSSQQKITAEVNVPQSKYDYVALEPPIIETPQLRDMGEATPPLEWIGLHRDRLPNLTHQIVIVALLELAGEVEDAYAKILGS